MAKPKKEEKAKKIRNQLIFIMIIVILLPVGLIGGASYRRSFKILSGKLALTTEQTTNEVKGTMIEYMAGIENQVSALAENSFIIELAKEENEVDEYKNLGFELLENFNQHNNSVVNTFIISKNGNEYKNPQNNQLRDTSLSTSQWYQTAVSNPNVTTWSKPTINSYFRDVTITVAKAIVHNGEVLGVIGFEIDMKVITDKLMKTKLGSEGYVALINTDGVFISHPDENVVGTNTLTEQAIWQEISSKDSGFVNYEYNGDKQFISFTAINSIDWIILGVMNNNELVDDTKALRNFILIGSIIASFIAIGIAAIIAIGISIPLNVITNAFNKVSMGDLSVRTNLKHKDEFGQLSNSFNDMVENIKDLVIEVKQSSETVVETSTALANITQQTSAATNEVALTIEEIAKSAGEQAKDTEIGVMKINCLANKIDEVKQSTSHVYEVSEETNQLSVKGLETVKLLIEKTLESSHAAGEVGKIVDGVNKSSESISTITQTITSIAEQTNLLALNAAIEAARAGEAGKGFAVVAEEIRKLAEQSGKATKEIRQLIEDIQTRAQLAVRAMNDTKSIVEKQNDAVKETESIFNQISTAIESVMNQVITVQKSTEEMAMQKDEIIEVIENVSVTAEETSASTQQVSAATEEQLASMEEVTHHAADLKILAEQLELLINKFIVN